MIASRDIFSFCPAGYPGAGPFKAVASEFIDDDAASSRISAIRK